MISISKNEGPPKFFLSSRLKNFEDFRLKIKKELEIKGYKVELPEESINPENKLQQIHDLCLNYVKNSDALLVILGYGYGTTKGLLFEISILEAEIFMAILKKIPVWVFIVKRHNTDRRMYELIRYLKCLLNKNQIYEFIDKNDDVIENIKKIIPKISAFNIESPKNTIQEFQHRLVLVNGCLGNGWQSMKELRFLNDMQFISNAFEEPNLEELNNQFQKIVEEENYHKRMIILWKIMHILQSVPFRNKKGQRFWEAWEKALKLWLDATSWLGLQGPIYLGGLAACYSLLDLYNLRVKDSNDEKWKMLKAKTHASISSQTYSVAKRVGLHSHQKIFLNSIFLHLKKSEELFSKYGNISNLAGIYSIRAHVYQQMGYLEKAVTQFRKSERYRKQAGDSYPALKVDLGFALLGLKQFREANLLVEDGVAELEESRRFEFLIRAKRKRGDFYRIKGYRLKAMQNYEEARELAIKFGVEDQLIQIDAQL